MKVKLKVLKGGSAGKEIAISGSEFIIGRDECCHLRPHSDMISRKHCTLTLSDAGVTIDDHGSKNGTFVNGERVDGNHSLSEGDSLRVGPLEFEVLVDHSLGGAKKSRVETVEQAAVRATEINGASENDDISSWLSEADEIDRERRLADPDTRQFKLDDTSRAELEAAKASKGGKGGKKGLFGRGEKKKKKEPGKLPPPPEFSGDDSKEAAAEMLKKLFNRG